MSESPLHYETLAELAAAIREGRISPVDIVEHHLTRIESLDPKLNAYRMVCRERALAAAQTAALALRAGQDLSPLHGIPYAAKDLFDVRGLPTTAGSHLLEKNVAGEDACVIQRLIQAGMVFLGKTNTVQFAYGGVGVNHDHGTPHNPWQEVPHVPGGSSSGSAVGVASGMATMALGSDTGGSVRIPASLCGITGLKTTVGRIGRSGVFPLSGSLDTVGVLARTVEDAALVYEHIQGFDRQDETTWGQQPTDILRRLKGGVRGLRLAFAESFFWEDVDPEIEKAVRETGKVFEDLGAHVGSIQLPVAEETLKRNANTMVLAAEAYTHNRGWVDDHYDHLDPIVASRLLKGKEISASDYLECLLDLKKLRAKSSEALHDVEALLVPTTIIPPGPLAEVDVDLETYTQYNLSYLRNTSIGNALNLCGLSVPCGFTRQGLPIGLMIYGKPFQEDIVIRIGYAFQQATTWHKKRPDLSWITQGDD
jgi:aspartyl-tRNA(Asn)/glutamyl-tRNA(Gln) amidotransferase subunit A